MYQLTLFLIRTTQLHHIHTFSVWKLNNSIPHKPIIWNKIESAKRSLSKYITLKTLYIVHMYRSTYRKSSSQTIKLQNTIFVRIINFSAGRKLSRQTNRNKVSLRIIPFDLTFVYSGGKFFTKQNVSGIARECNFNSDQI